MKFTKFGKICSLASVFITGLCTAGSAQEATIEPQAADAEKAIIQKKVKTDFIRVSETDKNVFLQTAVTRYTKGDVIVDFIGAVHIADKAYYNQLNKEFTNYESLLFEMVGGEAIKEHLKGNNQQAGKKDLQMSFLTGMYNTMTKKLDLTGQKDGIDYSKDNFVHADLTLQEFNDLQKKKGESLLKFAFKNALEQSKGKGKGPKPPSSVKLLKAMLLGTPNDLKMIIVDTLGGADDQIGAIAGKKSVIIGDRNIKCLKVMSDEITAGKKNIAIFYGAAHFPDMEERMIEMGYKQTNHRWLDAWKLNKKVKAQKNLKEEEKEAA